MYQELAVFALLIFLYSTVAGRIERSIISGPMIYVTVGFLLGPMFLGWFTGGATRMNFRVLADLTLALILFIDAANADMSVLKRQIQIPSRMLLIGLPGVIFLGSVLALLLFDQLTIYEAAILGTMLAATDAALGKAVITNKNVPARLREGLNFESGMNDGMCVPLLLIFIALAEGTFGHDGDSGSAIAVVVQELGIGLAVGLGLASLGAGALRVSVEKGWITEIWMQVTVVGLALACFALAQSVHGSGYVAAFSGGLMFGYLVKGAVHDLVLAAEGTAEIMAMLTWLVFGVAVIGQHFELFTWQVFLYALLSLTLIRVLPIFLSLSGTGESVSTRLFLGWFGPRGLASIVFAIIVLNTDLPGASFISVVVVCTVALSLIVHGITANPLSRWLAAKER